MSQRRGVIMSKRVDTEGALAREHAARELRRASAFILNLVLAGLFLAAGAAAQLFLGRFDPIVTGVAVVAALAVLLCLRIALQWDRAIVLRLGTFHALKGPGVFWIVPFVDRVARYVDMRIRATEFFSESTLTRDTVPVDVDAVCFWLVRDGQKAVREVGVYYRAFSLSHQYDMRGIIDTH